MASSERDRREALRVAQKINSREAIAIITCNILVDTIDDCGLDIIDNEDLDNFETMGVQVLQLAEELWRQDLIAWACYILTIILKKKGKQEEALPYAHHAVDIFTKLGSPLLEYALEALKSVEGK